MSDLKSPPTFGPAETFCPRCGHSPVDACPACGFPARQEPEWQIGFVAYIDILGYKALAQQKGGAEAVKDVVKTLNESPSAVRKRLTENLVLPRYIWSPERKEIMRDSLQQIEQGTRVMSDSILLFLPCRSSPDVDEKAASKGLVFVGYCQGLCSHLFREGLPVRGAISHGEYLLAETMFAGTPIMAAYELSGKIDASCVVITPEFETLCRGIKDKTLSKVLDRFVPEIPVPLKNAGTCPLRVLKYTPQEDVYGGKGPAGAALDVRIKKFVYDAFTKHQGTIPADVYRKYFNTIGMFEKTFASPPHEHNT